MIVYLSMFNQDANTKRPVNQLITHIYIFNIVRL